MSLVQLFLQKYLDRAAALVSDLESIMLFRVFIPSPSKATSQSDQAPAMLHDLLFKRLTSARPEDFPQGQPRASDPASDPRFFFDACLGTDNYAGVVTPAWNDVQHVMQDEVRPAAMARAQQMVAGNTTGLLLKDDGLDIDTQFLTLYQTVFDAAVQAGVGSLTFGLPEGPTRDVIEAGFRARVAFAVAEAWMQGVLAAVRDTTFPAAFPTMMDVCTTAHLCYRHDIVRLFRAGIDPAPLLTRGVESLDCMVNAGDDALLNANKRSDHTFSTRLSNDRQQQLAAHLGSVQRTLVQQDDKYADDAAQARSMLTLETRILVAAAAVGVGILTHAMMAGVSSGQWFVVVSAAVGFAALISVEAVQMMSSRRA